MPNIERRLVVVPAAARVFAGNAVRFRAATIGISPDDVRWSTIGPATADPDGMVRAFGTASQSALVVASASGRAAAGSIDIVAPPSHDLPLAVVACYDDGTIDAHDADTFSSAGSASTGVAAAGVAADAERRVAYVADGDRLASFDLGSARFAYSAPVTGVRFSEVAALGGGFVAATDNNAREGRAGLRIFRAETTGKPVLRASAAAGETPEGLAVAAGGRTLYVTNVNGNSVMRFAFDGAGSVRITGRAATGHRPFGVAVDERNELLFVADNDTPTVSGASSRPGLEVFALPAMRRIARLTTGTANALPLGVAVLSNANRLFVTNEGDGTIAAYSIHPLRRIATLPAGRTPWLPALDAQRGRLYVPSAMGNAFSVYDARTLRPLVRDAPTCGYPTSIAIVRPLSPRNVLGRAKLAHARMERSIAHRHTTGGHE